MRQERLTHFALALIALWMVGAVGRATTSTTAPTAELESVGTQEEREETFSQVFEIGPGGSLSLSNVSGQIVVRGTSGNEIEIEAIKRVYGARSDDDGLRQLERVKIDVSQTGNRIRVHTRYNDRNHRHGGDTHVSVDFDVTVPQGTEVSVQSVSGDVEVGDVNGELQAESVSGNVAVSNAGRLILAKSVSGSVEVLSVDSDRDVEISSVSGDVDVGGISARELEVSSVSGDVKILDASCERVISESVSGDIRFSGSLAPGGRYEFESHSGDVRVEIPEGIGFELEAQTFSGEIESDFPLTVHSLPGEQREVRGVYGDGSALLEATAFSGDITIERR